jgi:hypothetical protein
MQVLQKPVQHWQRAENIRMPVFGFESLRRCFRRLDQERLPKTEAGALPG